MASIHNSRVKKYARLTEGDEPTERLESIGDRLIKELAEKQSDTKLTLEKQFRQEKQFEKRTGLVSLSCFSAGTSSLEDFQKKTKDAEALQQLAARGLTVDEARRYISGQDVLYSTKAESSARTAQRDLLVKCLADDNVDSNQNTSVAGLTRREVGLNVKPDSVETRLLQFALSCRKSGRVDVRPASHPINNLAEIEKDLFKERPNPLVLAKTVTRKRRQELDALLPPQYVSTNPAASKGSSLWDMIDKPVIVADKKPSETRLYGCNEQRLYTIRDGKIVQAGKEKQTSRDVSDERRAYCNGQPFVQSGVVEESSLGSGVRLSEAEIRQMPKFRNYDRGKSSKTLYVKNIAGGVKEEDLVGIFCGFQETGGPKLIYRLMNGKMRGQAFITFPNAERAAAALDGVNGFVLKGKPLIIQFGRDSTG